MTIFSKHTLLFLLIILAELCYGQVPLQVNQDTVKSTFYINHFDYLMQSDTMIYTSRGKKNFQTVINLHTSIPVEVINKNIFLDRADNLSISIDSFGHKIFKGKYPGNYAFHDSLKSIFEGQGLKPATKNIELLSALNEKIFNKHLQTLKHFQTNHTTSADFDEYIRSEVYFRHYANVYKPIFNKKSQIATLPNHYLNGINQNYIFHNRAFSSRAYQDFIRDYIEYYTDTLGTKVGLQKLNGIISYIDLKFDKPHQDWLKVGFLRQYAKRIKPEETTAFYELAAKTANELSDATYKAICEKTSTHLKKSAETIPDEVLNYKLFTSDKKEISLRQIIASNKSKVIYVDFWASWCGPCIEMLPYSKKLKTNWGSKGVETIYISLDFNTNEWQKGIKKHQITNEQNFLIDNDGEPSIVEKYFNVNSIPRYLIIDKAGKLINKDAPRPDNVSLLEGIFNSLGN